MTTRMITALCLDAFLPAIWRRRPQGVLMVPSNRGSQERDLFDIVGIFHHPGRRHVMSGAAPLNTSGLTPGA